MELNRRNFLKISGAGAAGSLLTVYSNAAASVPVNANNLKSSPIIYRTLGRTGIKVPIVSMGAMRADNSALLKIAVENGMVHFDTAQSYQSGKNEELLGTFLKDYDRSKYIIATKVRVPQAGMSKEEFMAMVDESLKRLQTTYIDILYYHAVSKTEVVLNPELISLMEEARKSGKVKFTGISTHTNMANVIKASVEAKVYDVLLTSYNVKMANDNEMTEALEIAGKANLGIVVMKTMLGGYWDRGRTKKVNTKAALKWALQNENVHTSIPGATTFEQLNECISVMSDINLTDQEKEDLKGDGTTAGLYCTGCQECVPQCPYNVPIPDMMRSYMYAYGYADVKLAREVLDNMPEVADQCDLCPVCSVTCRQGFNIQAKAKDILRVKDIPVEFLV